MKLRIHLLTLLSVRHGYNCNSRYPSLRPSVCIFLQQSDCQGYQPYVPVDANHVHLLPYRAEDKVRDKSRLQTYHNRQAYKHNTGAYDSPYVNNNDIHAPDRERPSRYRYSKPPPMPFPVSPQHWPSDRNHKNRHWQDQSLTRRPQSGNNNENLRPMHLSSHSTHHPLLWSSDIFCHIYPLELPEPEVLLYGTGPGGSHSLWDIQPSARYKPSVLPEPEQPDRPWPTSRPDTHKSSTGGIPILIGIS